jgi:hypothetical protein
MILTAPIVPKYCRINMLTIAIIILGLKCLDIRSVIAFGIENLLTKSLESRNHKNLEEAPKWANYKPTFTITIKSKELPERLSILPEDDTSIPHLKTIYNIFILLVVLRPTSRLLTTKLTTSSTTKEDLSVYAFPYSPIDIIPFVIFDLLGNRESDGVASINLKSIVPEFFTASIHY